MRVSSMPIWQYEMSLILYKHCERQSAEDQKGLANLN